MTYWNEFFVTLVSESFRQISMALLLALAVTGPVVGALVGLHRYSNRRELVRLGKLACPNCGSEFGLAAARDAKTRYEAECAEEAGDCGEHCTAFITFDDLWDVRCPQCGTTTKFDSFRKSLLGAKPSESETIA